MFKERLAELRDDNHDTQLTLAQKLGVAKSTVSNWEQGKSGPGFQVLCDLCKLYGVTSDYLLGLSEDDPLFAKKRREQFTAEDKKVLRLFEEFLIFKKAQKQ